MARTTTRILQQIESGKYRRGGARETDLVAHLQHCVNLYLAYHDHRAAACAQCGAVPWARLAAAVAGVGSFQPSTNAQRTWRVDTDPFDHARGVGRYGLLLLEVKYNTREVWETPDAAPALGEYDEAQHEFLARLHALDVPVWYAYNTTTAYANWDLDRFLDAGVLACAPDALGAAGRVIADAERLPLRELLRRLAERDPGGADGNPFLAALFDTGFLNSAAWLTSRVLLLVYNADTQQFGALTAIDIRAQVAAFHARVDAVVQQAPAGADVTTLASGLEQLRAAVREPAAKFIHDLAIRAQPTPAGPAATPAAVTPVNRWAAAGPPAPGESGPARALARPGDGARTTLPAAPALGARPTPVVPPDRVGERTPGPGASPRI